ncbi:nitroreductase family deazaflavin-dependent oxidoreductase [Amycolatopsis mongoliensis]|uniref:Nitroreductase family deazaflavin-dependent oxidoreductase n=1 Tax=Amycolatopsis mongoliensis TaxID=715475 RepID=A0A9Y2JNV8_9PSEU|nr:nitroreductase family deazaflavin-dependent oxidoreductase [Amycolatopsis sp. 4-36]WIY00891.1 nitroreductase family deazaflavin-dependent oxidoreductase [Amycolatopsis sp. 4-36]
MPWPPFLKPAHTIINPIALRRAGRAGSLAVVIHRGRRSGRTYRTPVRAFRRGDIVAIGANFGANSDWVQNILAAGEGELRLRGELCRLTEPRLLRLDELPPVFPRWYRWVLRSLVHTHQCLVMHATKHQQR